MLINLSRNSVLCEKVRFARSSFERFKGLMFERESNFDYALVFELPFESRLGASIHMLFVFFPIDVVYLDSDKRVVDVVSAEPWGFNYTPRKPAKFFVELRRGLGKKVSVGDFLSWS